jgi:hypothetical protein
MPFPFMLYTSDDGNVYAVKVDQVYVDMPERGWTDAAIATTPQYPRGWKTRAVFGVTELGGLVLARCATVDCELWTGLITQITYMTRSGQLAVAVVVGKYAERTLKVRIG